MPEAYRIIIAEDEQVLAFLLARLIMRICPTAVVQTFGDGQDALDAYDQHGADLLLVNHAMPRLDGSTLIRTVRARGDTVPIIGMSGNPYYCADYMTAGATAFLSGPELLGELARLLRCLLPPLSNIQPIDVGEPLTERALEMGGGSFGGLRDDTSSA